jgi:hypothetical protein
MIYSTHPLEESMMAEKVLLVVYGHDRSPDMDSGQQRAARLNAALSLFRCERKDLSIRHYDTVWAFRDVLSKAREVNADAIDLVGLSESFAAVLFFPRCPHEGFKGKIIEGKQVESGEWNYKEITGKQKITLSRRNIRANAKKVRSR